MFTGIFNNWGITQAPSAPAAKSIDWKATEVVAASTSPFSGQQQIQDWGTAWLEATVTMPPLTHKQAQAWIAFLLQLGGLRNCFQLGDPLATSPQGAGAGTGSPVTNGASFGYFLATRGWTPSAQNVLLPGDWLQIGYRLYRNLDVVSADAGGSAMIAIWPQLREIPADGTPLILQNTSGLFRLSSNSRSWSMTEAKIYGLNFAVREAL